MQGEAVERRLWATGVGDGQRFERYVRCRHVGDLLAAASTDRGSSVAGGIGVEMVGGRYVAGGIGVEMAGGRSIAGKIGVEMAGGGYVTGGIKGGGCSKNLVPESPSVFVHPVFGKLRA